MNDEMTTTEFLIWLRGYVDGVGNEITPEQWKKLVDAIEKHPIFDVDSGKYYDTKKLLRG